MARDAAASGPRGRAGPSRRRTRSTCGTAASTGASGWSPARTVGDFGAFVGGRQGRRGHGLLRAQRRADGPDRPACSAATTTPARYAELADGVRAAWRAEYLDADGRLTPDTQANHVRALAFDLVPDELRPAVADRLVELIRAAGTHLGTGFLATPYLLPVLADTGHLDVAYELLLQDTEPSWLAMIDRGATTVWERWNGVDADGVPHESLNHYTKGAVVSFLHRYVAGIELLDDGPGVPAVPRSGPGPAAA